MIWLRKSAAYSASEQRSAVRRGIFIALDLVFEEHAANERHANLARPIVTEPRAVATGTKTQQAQKSVARPIVTEPRALATGTKTQQAQAFSYWLSVGSGRYRSRFCNDGHTGSRSARVIYDAATLTSDCTLFRQGYLASCRARLSAFRNVLGSTGFGSCHSPRLAARASASALAYDSRSSGVCSSS